VSRVQFHDSQSEGSPVAESGDSPASAAASFEVDTTLERDGEPAPSSVDVVNDVAAGDPAPDAEQQSGVFELGTAVSEAYAPSEITPAPKRPKSMQGVVGSSAPLIDVFSVVDRVADTDCTVLITGESGTGKELVARGVHAQSPRRNGPFVAVNCGAIPEALLESELFGHARGAFTGAHQTKLGRIGAAERGTLFLDEIGELSLGLQVKLLRVLQAREYSPVGDTRVLKADVRVVAATNMDLEKAVAEGNFRQDLYYRLNVIMLHVPELKRRASDIPELVLHFMAMARE
jgi:transcriptional regulator with PAS, ATPase and Fis domain